MSETKHRRTNEKPAGLTLAGVIVAPFAGALISAWGSMIVVSVMDVLANRAPLLHADYAASSISMLTVIALQIAFVVGLPASFVFGLPIHLLLGRVRLRGLIPYIVGGALISILGLAVAEKITNSELPRGSLEFAGIPGAIGGLVFWFIRRPDRDRATAS